LGNWAQHAALAPWQVELALQQVALAL